MLTKRSLMTGAAAAATLPIGSRAKAAAKSLSVGYIADYPNGSVLAIAADQKLWAAEGLNADVKVFTTGPIQIQAMGAGSLDFGTIGPGALWLPASGRAKIVGVNDIGFSDRIIAQAGITSITQLKGKKVGVPQGTSGDMILRLGLAKAGMTIADIQPIPMDPSTIVAAFTSKQIDAAGIWYPLIDVIKAKVPELNELAASKDFYPGTSFINTFVAGNDVVKKDPDLVKGFIRVMKKAMDWRVANFEKSIQLTTAFLNAPANLTENVARSRKLLTSQELDAFTKDGTVDKWLAQFNSLFKEFGTLANPLPPDQFYEGKLFVSA